MHVLLGADKATGLAVVSVVLLNQIRAVDKQRLIKRLGSIDEATAARRSKRVALGCEHPAVECKHVPLDSKQAAPKCEHALSNVNTPRWTRDMARWNSKHSEFASHFLRILMIRIGGVRFWPSAGAAWIFKATFIPATTCPNAAKP